MRCDFGHSVPIDGERVECGACLFVLRQSRTVDDYRAIASEIIDIADREELCPLGLAHQVGHSIWDLGYHSWTVYVAVRIAVRAS